MCQAPAPAGRRKEEDLKLKAAWRAWPGSLRSSEGDWIRASAFEENFLDPAATAPQDQKKGQDVKCVNIQVGNMFALCLGHARLP